MDVSAINAHLTRDGQKRFIDSGKPVLSFDAAWNRQYNSNGEVVKEATFFHGTIWPVSDAQADYLLSRMKKGWSVSFTGGRIAVDPKTGQPRIWTDQQGGAHSSLDVTISAFDVVFNPNGAAPVEAPAEDQYPF